MGDAHGNGDSPCHAVVGLTPPATLSTSAECCQHHVAWQCMEEDILLGAAGAEPSFDVIHRFAQLRFTAILVAWKTSLSSSPSFPPSSLWVQTQSTCSSLTIHTWINTEHPLSMRACSWNQLNAEGWSRGSVCGKGLQIRLIVPGIWAEFSRTVCTAPCLHNGHV